MDRPTPPTFTTHSLLDARFDEYAPAREAWSRARGSLGAWRIARVTLLGTLRKLIGYGTFRRAPLLPQITETTDCGDHIRQRIEIQVEPDMWMPLYALLPRTGRPPWRAVICPHGHGSGGKAAVAGRRDLPEVAAAIDTYNYDYGVQCARAGLIAFCPDARGFGERQEAWMLGQPLNGSCQLINQMALPLGQTVTGMWAWDLHRLVDYVETRADCVPGAIGCAGLSGGGLQTLWAAALDERIRCAVISGYLYGYKQSLLDMPANCSCNYVPHLWQHADMGDIAALIAPRPLLIETGARDPLNGADGLDNVRPQLALARSAWQLYGAEERLVHDVFGGEHLWHGALAIPFLVRHLSAQGGSA